MPYIYPDPILSGVNPFAQSMAPQPVPTQNGMTQPMPVRPGSGQAVNTQGFPQVVQDNLRENLFGSSQYGIFDNTIPSMTVEEYVQQEGTTDLPLFREGFDAKPGQTVGQGVAPPNITPPTVEVEEVVTTQSSGFEIIGLIAIASLIAYLAR